jgi:hypothetical protein
VLSEESRVLFNPVAFTSSVLNDSGPEPGICESAVITKFNKVRAVARVFFHRMVLLILVSFKRIFADT